MTTVQIVLPDELAQKAASAGLLSPQAMEAGQDLQAIWARAPSEELTPAIEQEIVADVHAARAERRRRGAA
jgi:hypothetical protein